jgi:amino acid adenylation domain-containing protein
MSNPAGIIADLPPQQQAIRQKCFHPTGTFVEFKREEIVQSIFERFEKIARLHPYRIAVKSRQQEFTYDGLNRAANCIAQVILNRIGGSRGPVALMFDNDASIIVALLGVLQAGTFYLPLDPSYPRERILGIIQSSGARLILTNSKNLSSTTSISSHSCPVINVDELDMRASMETLRPPISPDSPANILYTSGSTGQPKGVIQTHRNILHEIMNYTNGVHICAADRLALVSSPTFSDAVRTTYGALLNGAGLYPLDIKHEGSTYLARWLIEQEITIYRSVPSVFRHLVSTLSRSEQFPHLRVIYSAGDSVRWSDIMSYKYFFSSNCLFVNGLGSTESLTFRWYFINKDTPITGSSVPVGYGMPDKDVFIVDERGNEVATNEVGQIAVNSKYLSPGYWVRPDLTEAVFLPDNQGTDRKTYLTGDMGRLLSDGCLMHLGRKDFQVKIRGQRIEVAEIETALHDLASIKEAVVTAREDRTRERRLVAYLVPSDRPRPGIVALRRALSARLPDYMIPSAYIWLDALPLNANKKVDRRALPDPQETRPELDTPFTAPRTSMENAIARIWSEVLCVDPVGVHDNFFELGGHSLAAARVVSRVMKIFRLQLPLKALFESPTVADMSLVITRNQPEPAGQEDLAQALIELESLSDEEAEKLLTSPKEDE